MLITCTYQEFEHRPTYYDDRMTPVSLRNNDDNVRDYMICVEFC